MGALLIAARMHAQRKPGLIKYALIVPIILHAFYDLPLFAIRKDIAKIWFGAAWLGVIALSSVFVIWLCNRILPEAVEADRAAGCDQTSKETTDRLIKGGMAAVIGGPLLAVCVFYAEGFDDATGAMVLSILPVAFGIDSILTASGAAGRALPRAMGGSTTRVDVPLAPDRETGGRGDVWLPWCRKDTGSPP